MRRRPKHLSFACRPGDIAAAAERLGLDLSFCDVAFGDHDIPQGLRGPDSPLRFEVARGRSRHHGDLSNYFLSDFRLTICFVPRTLAGAVRELMRAEGLPLLLRWLDERRRLPETARTRNTALHLWFEGDRLEALHGETPSWSMRESP